MGELLAKSIARTARGQLDGRHVLFGKYLQYWTTPYLLNYSITVNCYFDLMKASSFVGCP